MWGSELAHIPRTNIAFRNWDRGVIWWLLQFYWTSMTLVWSKHTSLDVHGGSKRLCPRWPNLKERVVIKILDGRCVTKTYQAEMTVALSDYTKPVWLGEKNVVIFCGPEVLSILWVYVMKLHKARNAWTMKRLVTGQTTGIFLT